ncbi:MAG: hypothetical protein FJW34_09045 [Acidobacteria bacterium]|nr:hypothetical protein [Acidobacteriota bacterium]
MKRREFFNTAGCCAAGGALAPLMAQGAQTQPVVLPPRKRYTFEIEVVEGPKSRCHKVGEKFAYPQEFGKLCPWLRDAMSGILRAMEWGAVLPWTYQGTPYQKVIEPDGVTTEFIRCPDPTAAGIVVKITRTLVKA